MQHKEFKVEGVKEINPNKFGGMVSRAISLAKKEINFDEGIETIATTEAPALVVDWERWQVVREILPMKYAVLPENDKVPLLDSHSRFSIEMIKGSARNWRTEGSNLLAKTFISASESVVRDKIKEGHIDSVSIGYRTESEYTVEIPKNATVVIDGTSYKNEFDDDYPMVVRTWWKTHELSLVPIGADDAAKFKSIADDTQRKLLEKFASQEKLLNQIIEEVKQLSVVEYVQGKRLLKHFERLHQLNKNRLSILN